MKNLKEISAQMAEMESIKAQREFTDEEAKRYAELTREFNQGKRENDIELQERQAQSIKTPIEQKSLVAAIRENRGKEFEIQMRSGEFTTTSGAAAIDKNVQPVIDPVYANSALAKAGVKFYTNLPYGNIAIPVLGKGSVGWKGEVVAAGLAGETLTPVELSPKRLTAYIDISNMMLAQDTHEVNEAIQRDLNTAIYEKLEATVLGSAAGSSNQPAGIFYNETLEDGTDWGKACDVEATVEAANYNDLVYILSPASKADFRKMKYNGNTGAGVWAGNEVDGTPAIVTSNVADGTYVVGDFKNLAVGLWGNATITVDDKSQAINGVTRIVVSLFADAKIIRKAAFAFGKTRTIGE